MNLIVGLGNPGDTYSHNRHNAGFMFVEFLANKLEVVKPWKSDKYLDADMATIHFPITTNHTITTILAKPRTFMNKSGRAVNELLKKNEIPVENLIVVHDDLDIELGNFKIQTGTGPKVHNGLSSIESTLRRNDFMRVRIGVDNRSPEFRIPGETYVLQNFTTEEKPILEEIFPRILAQLIFNLK